MRFMRAKNEWSDFIEVTRSSDGVRNALVEPSSDTTLTVLF